MRENRFPGMSHPVLFTFPLPLAPMPSGHGGVLMYSVSVVITLSSLRSSGQQPFLAAQFTLSYGGKTAVQSPQGYEHPV